GSTVVCGHGALHGGLNLDRPDTTAMRPWQTVCSLIGHGGDGNSSITIARIACSLVSAPVSSNRCPPASTSGIAGCVMALWLRPSALYAMSLVSGCLIRAPRIHH